ncbi:MAG: serine/threonine protein kinase [Gemmatimonadales bacterium]|nr:MAG: serine/threonine protein kinase [Gemmatimonadales bacterium]
MNSNDSANPSAGASGERPGSNHASVGPVHPEVIGPYHILRVLGEGGMGVVYEAEQRLPMTRRVALKVMKPGLDSREVLARFEAERQALAVMEHPGIAQVLDAGSTESGRPFFVMELVHGESLKDYADARKLSIEDRVRLVVEVCHAVQHAHLKGVIHRDLKPSNVLVSEQDGVPRPKVIDFGVAKATGARLTERTLVTGFGQALGTPAYMSPEQAGATGLDVDTRADVYSLGILLYELLVGRLPQDPNELGVAGFMTKLLMRDVDPPRPSTKYGTLEGVTQDAIARFRRTDPRGLRHKLRGDLDWIAMKAIEKDRDRRYATANDLALDLERCLRNEPVLARPPSARYRAAKFVRRHRVGVGMTAAAVLLVIASAVAVSVMAAGARRALARATAAEEFLRETIWVSDPFQGAGPEVTLVAALDVASGRIAELEGQPEVEASVKSTFGVTYFKLSQYEAARDLLESALEIRTELYQGPHPELAESLDQLAQLERAEGRLSRADSLFRTALAMRRETLGDTHPDVAVTLMGLGILAKDRRDFDAADSAFREALDIRERSGADPGALAEVWDALGTMYVDQERYDEAESLLRRALDARRSFYGPEAGLVASSMNNLANLLDDMGQYDEAAELYRGARTLFQARAPRSSQLATITANLALLLDLRKNRYDEAEDLYREALALRLSLFGDGGSVVADSKRLLAAFLCEVRGESREGAALLAEAIPVLEQEGDRFRVAVGRSMQGVCLTAVGRYGEGEAALLQAIQAFEVDPGCGAARTEQARERLAALYEAWGRPDRAAMYSQAADCSG